MRLICISGVFTPVSDISSSRPMMISNALAFILPQVLLNVILEYCCLDFNNSQLCVSLHRESSAIVDFTVVGDLLYVITKHRGAMLEVWDAAKPQIIGWSRVWSIPLQIPENETIPPRIA